MALVTVERSTPSPQQSQEDDLEVMSGSSGYEGFVATRSLVMFLPSKQWTPSNKKELLAIETHLKKLYKLSRPEDTVRLVIELEKLDIVNNSDNSDERTRYLVLLTTVGYQGKEECIILGTENNEDTIQIGLVLPIWSDTKVKLDGDGGFVVYTADRHHLFKPTSVQSMWSALQTLYKYSEMARLNNFYVGGLSHTWISWYSRTLTGSRTVLNEWNLMEDIDIHRIDSPTFFALGKLGEEKDTIKKLLIHKLREIMLHEDLEQVSVKQLKRKVAEEVGMDLSPYNAFLDQQMMVILKQMEKPSKIYDYLYLGSEWNAADLDELQDLKIGYILNITREIDNFYPGMFSYKNIRVYDVSSSDLLKHWDETYKFIKEAKMAKSNVLVHCKMGISRSASTVIAYAMKEYQLPLQEAIDYVKSCRNIVHPNPGFTKQLKTYEAILQARNNEVWGVQAPSRIFRRHRRSLSDPNRPLIPIRRESPISCCQFNNNKPEQRGEDNSAAVYPQLTEATITSQLQALDHQSADQKVHSFLDSMSPFYNDEEDQGIASNSPLSNSNSGFSSPMCVTPPDEGYLEKWREGKLVPPSQLPEMSSHPSLGKEIVVPSPIEASQPVIDIEIADSKMERKTNENVIFTPFRNSNFKPYESFTMDTTPLVVARKAMGVSAPLITQSHSFPENLSQLMSSFNAVGDKEEVVEKLRPVSVMELTSTANHRRVKSDAITVLPTQKDWRMHEERLLGRTVSLDVTKQIDSVKQQVKMMEQVAGQSQPIVEARAPSTAPVAAHTVTLVVCSHSRKSSTFSIASSQESSRPVSQFSTHEREDETAAKRFSGCESPVKELNKISEQDSETIDTRKSKSTSPAKIVDAKDAIITTQLDSVRTIVQDIEKKSTTNSSTTISPTVQHASLSRYHSVSAESTLAPHPNQLQATTAASTGLPSSSRPLPCRSPKSSTSDEHLPAMSPSPLNRHHTRVRSYSSSPLSSPKMSPKFPRGSPEAIEVFEQQTCLPSMAGYSKEKLIRRRSLDIYQKHGDCKLMTIPSVSQLKKLFEGLPENNAHRPLKRSHSLKDICVPFNPLSRSASLRSEGP